jgi:small subunit ribosomal protein S20
VPHHKSASKRLRQGEVRRQRNVHFRSTMRSAIKQVRQALDKGDVDGAQKFLAEATQIIDATRNKGVIHARTASRKISRLTRAVNTKLS